MAAEFEDSFDVEAELVGGDNGIFDVHVEGRRVFSKHEEGRFPKDGEVMGRIQE